MSLRLLFINAIDTTRSVQTKFPPLGFGYLYSALRQRLPDESFECRVVDRGVDKHLAEFKPDIVGVSSVSQNFGRAKDYAALARGNKIPVVAGGVHISMIPESLDVCMDVAVLGEGEETFAELMRSFMSRGRLELEDLREIPGLAFRGADNKLIRTAPRPLIEPLDLVSAPDRGLFPPAKQTYLFTSRGCPYRCSFCASTRYWHTARFFSAERVVDEIADVISGGARRIAFYDDIFPAHHARLKKIVELLDERGLSGKATFFTSMRSSMVTEENVSLLKRMGVDGIGLGLESASEPVLAYLKGGAISVADHQRALQIIRAAGIPAHCSFIIGSPDETAADIDQTASFIRKNKLSSYDVYALTPFPGTPVWQEAALEGHVSERMDWAVLDVDFARNWKRAVILSRHFRRSGLRRVYRRFMRLKTLMNVRRKWMNLVEKIKGDRSHE